MALADYRCATGHVSERRFSTPVAQVHCGCGLIAVRIWTNPPATVAPIVDSRGMFRRYQEATAEMDHAASKEEARTGQAPVIPDLWSAAKARAAAVDTAGEAQDFKVKS